MSCFGRFRSLGLAICVVLAGCGQDNVGGHAYCPLVQGSVWEYTVTTTSADGEFMEAGLISRVDGTLEIGGEEFIRIVNANSGSNPGEEEIIYFRSSSEGVLFAKKFELDHPAQLYIPAAPQVGDTWSVVTPTANTQNAVDAFEAVELEGARYENCMKVISQGTVLSGFASYGIRGVTYYAPGIGQVLSRMTMVSETGETVPITITLIKHSI